MTGFRGSSMTKLNHKLVAVLNKSIEPGKLMNALAHMSIGLGSMLGMGSLQLQNYVDADKGSHPYISAMPFMILSANSNKISNLRIEAQQAGLSFTDFVESMTVGSYEEQLERTRNLKAEELVYYGIVLYGDWDEISQLTRKFSLWR